MSNRGKKQTYLRRLTWAQWRILDPYAPGKYSTFYLSVYEPTLANPCPAILLRLSSGSGSVFIRFGGLASLQEAIVVPECYLARVEEAMSKANQIADQLEDTMRIAMHRRQLAQGGQIVRTDTGEVLAEAEKILRRMGD